MELSLRTVRIFNRLLRKPFGITSYRNVTGTAIKEEVNTELLNSFNQDIRNGKSFRLFKAKLHQPEKRLSKQFVRVFSLQKELHVHNELYVFGNGHGFSAIIRLLRSLW